MILDVGIQPPAEVPFAPGFVRAPGRAVGRPTGSRAQAEQSLLDADKAFSTAIARDGAAVAFRQVMHPGGRPHRNRVLPMTSREEAAKYLQGQVKTMTRAAEERNGCVW